MSAWDGGPLLVLHLLGGRRALTAALWVALVSVVLIAIGG